MSLYLPYLTLHTYTYILLMTPKYVSLTSKFSIFVGVRVNQRVFLSNKADSGIHKCVTHTHTLVWYVGHSFFSFFYYRCKCGYIVYTT